MTLPDSRLMSSTFRGLYLHDSSTGKRLLVSDITNSIGTLVSSNVLVYSNCFASLKGDLVLKGTPAGLAQDVVIRESLSWIPFDEIGFDPKSTVLEAWTEFFDSPTPEKQTSTLAARAVAEGATDALSDDTLKFGDILMVPGRAYLNDTTNTAIRLNAPAASRDSVPVGKTWIEQDNRRFLIERVRWREILPHFKRLETNSLSANRSAAFRPLHAASDTPPKLLASTTTTTNRTILLAQSSSQSHAPTLSPSPNDSPAFILDYTTVLCSGGICNGYRFEANETYFIGSQLTISGTATFVGGAVIKFADTTSNAGLGISGTAVFDTGPGRMVLFTGEDDDSVGATICGSTGNPGANKYGYPVLFFTSTAVPADIKYIRISYAAQNMEFQNAGPNKISHSQFVNAWTGIVCSDSTLNIYNCLFYEVGPVFEGWGFTVNAQHLTAHSGYCLAFDWWEGATVNLVNSLIIGLNNTCGVTYNVDDPTEWLHTDPGNVFETAGLGAHYLPETSPHRTAGTSAIDPDLAFALKDKTTRAPASLPATSGTLALAQRVTRNGNPPYPLGYSYDPIDYLGGGLQMQSGTLLITNGITVGLDAGASSTGIRIAPGVELASQGSPTSMNRLLEVRSVQEQPGAPVSLFTTIHQAFGGPSHLRLRFTELVGRAGINWHIYRDNGLGSMALTDCQMFGGGIGGSSGWSQQHTIGLTNNLFENCNLSIVGTAQTHFDAFNNTFTNSHIVLNGGSFSWNLRDNLFLSCYLGVSPPIGNSHNGYYLTYPLASSGPNHTLTAQPNYASGPFGKRYYTEGSNPLHNGGSRSPTAAGLFHHTTRTTQQKEGSKAAGLNVDVGFHYVAANNANNLPIDSDGEGLADYYEDRNGNNVHEPPETSWVDDDTDSDSLSDAAEPFVTGTDPNDPDTSGSGFADGYQDDDADGWANVDEVRNGTNPLNPDNTRSPDNLHAVFNGTFTVVTLTWDAVLSAQSYTIERNTGPGFVPLQTVPSTTLTLTDTPGTINVLYRVKANFAWGGSIPGSAVHPLLDPFYTVEARILRGAEGKLQLVASTVPTGLLGFEIERYTVPMLLNSTEVLYSPAPPFLFIIPIEFLVDGKIDLISTTTPLDDYDDSFGWQDEAPPYAIYQYRVRGVGLNLKRGNWGPVHYTHSTPFVDGRAAMNASARFLLRAADSAGPFNFVLNTFNPPNEGPGFGAFPDYVHVAFHRFAGQANFPDPQLIIPFLEFRPFEINRFWRKLIFSPDIFNSEGQLNTGASFLGRLVIVNPWDEFHTYSHLQNGYATGEFSPPSVITSHPDQRIYNRGFDFIVGDMLPIGCVPDGFDAYAMSSPVFNHYGLNVAGLRKVEVFQEPTPLSYIDILPNDSFLAAYGSYFMHTAQPDLETVSYYFANPLTHPVPGKAGFTPSQPNNNLLIASVGKSIKLAGWAKQRIANGDQSKFAYIAQYFDKAFKANPDGSASSVETGVLSEYGEFFPTEPGRAILKTKLDSGQQGQCTVHVIKLELDANHNGIMESSFFAADNTSEAKPFVFWINNDTDADNQDSPVPAGPDHNNEFIESERDLEDFARLWWNSVPDLPDNAGYEVIFSMRVISGSPKIKLYNALEAAGGTAYLNDPLTAQAIIGGFFRFSVGAVSAAQTMSLEPTLSQRVNPGYLLFEGAGAGKAELILSVKQNGQTIASTSAFIELKYVKQMYERWTLNDSGDLQPRAEAYPASEELPEGAAPFCYPYDPARDSHLPFIVHVHGWNQTIRRKDTFADTAFKRLFWQGYQGRFAAFRWPTYVLGAESALLNNYDSSEWQAWKSGIGLRNKLTELNQKYPNEVRLSAHSMGNVVAGEALRVPDGNRLVRVYAAMQAAVPSHAYDASRVTRSLGVFDSGTPNRYAQYFANGSPPYFSGFRGADAYVNFYNPVDAALGTWEIDQNVKPANSIGYDYELEIFSHGLRILQFQQDTHELFSFCVEARCFALGAQAGLQGQFDPLVGGSEVLLDPAPYFFGATFAGHSAQFEFTNMRSWLFWQQVVASFEITVP